MRRGQGGFALVLMMVVLAGGGALFVSALSTHSAARPRATVMRAGDWVRLVADRAAEVYLRDGSFPASLTALATASVLPVDGGWALDPFGGGAELQYRALGVPATLEVRSVGPDLRANTADDIVETRSGAVLGRCVTSRRLAVLRSAFFASSLMARNVSAADRATLALATRRYRSALRAWPTATVAERVTLRAEMDQAELDVEAVRTANLLPALPTAVAGAGLLLDQIGHDQAMATDGFGRALSIDPVLGVRSDGVDGIGGNDDDF